MRTKFLSAFMLCMFILPVLLTAQALPFSQLDPKPYDPATDPNPDMYTGSWKDSMPIKTHGAIIERAILTAGDPMEPPTKGAVLKYTNRFVRASIGAYESTSPVTLQGEQEIFYVLSGKGTVSSGGKTEALHPGIAVLVPQGVEFTMSNTGAETLAMYLIAEPVPEGFKGNREMKVVDENKQAWNTGNPHWVGLSKPLFSAATGLSSVTNIITVQFDPMTMFQPHSHREGIEEVWTAVSGDIHFLLGKQIRKQPVGTAYLIPPDGKTPHANFNVSDDRIKLLYFSRFPGK
ncbi:cupin domain-containing protein [Candidatus Latescibacterota bacterium]